MSRRTRAAGPSDQRQILGIPKPITAIMRNDSFNRCVGPMSIRISQFKGIEIQSKKKDTNLSRSLGSLRVKNVPSQGAEGYSYLMNNNEPNVAFLFCFIKLPHC